MAPRPTLARPSLVPARETPPARRTVSLVVPFFNEAESLPRLLEALDAYVREASPKWSVSFDAILVDDGGDDGGCDVIAARADAGALAFDVRVIRLSRNFGKEIALTAGLMAAQADAVVFLDADLQHPLALIDAFLEGWLNEGYDVVYGYQAQEREAWWRRVGRGGFYRLISATTDITIPPGAGDFRLMSRRAYQALRQLGEQQRLMKGLYSWIGFRQKGVPFTAPPRRHGGTKFSPLKLLMLGLDGVTSFSTAPLRMAIWTGLGLAVLSGGYGLFSVFEALVLGVRTPGYPTLIVAISMIGAAQLIFLGVIGEYLGNVLHEVKNRPLFIVESDDRFAGESGREASQEG